MKTTKVVTLVRILLGLGLSTLIGFIAYPMASKLLLEGQIAKAYLLLSLPVLFLLVVGLGMILWTRKGKE